jgi:hypothetical protein
MYWFGEKETSNVLKCCNCGAIKIPPYKQPPQFLFELIYKKEDRMSKHFLPKIRQYNSLFAFTSMGGNIDKNINKGQGPYVFHINGQIHHQIGSLVPRSNDVPKYAELYIFDKKMKFKIG